MRMLDGLDGIRGAGAGAGAGALGEDEDKGCLDGTVRMAEAEMERVLPVLVPLRVLPPGLWLCRLLVIALHRIGRIQRRVKYKHASM